MQKRLKKLRERPKTLSLRSQIALVIASLSLLPNVVVVIFFLLPIVRSSVEVSVVATLPLIIWGVALLGISVSVGYLLSKQLLAPLTRASTQIGAMQRLTHRLAQAQLHVREDEPAEV